ncbi:MAG: glycosyltransferase family 39 protein [Acidobacteriota bacterium]|nr:glycosyltransferase family 39 protein [Acidobacteriota bacterium]
MRPFPPLSRRLVLWILLSLAVCPYFVDLNGSSIWDANEAFYVETPREMIERSDYVGPTFNYQPRFNKPVLSYWIVAGFYKVFGVSVGVQRVPIALGAVAMILIAFALARSAAPPDGTARSGGAGIEAALWAAVGLAVAPRLMMFGRRIFIDIYISMFMAATLLFFALSERYPERRRLFLFLMYASVGLGVLTKGPVAAALPGLVFALYLLVHGELKRVREMMIPMGAVVVLAIVVPWYAALYQRYGWTYITSFLLGENVARFTDGVGVETRRGPFFYLPVVLSDSFPWSLCLFGAAASWVADRSTRQSAPAVQPPEETRAARVRTLMWLWVIGIVGFFSFSAAKQDLYIFPIVPVVAALGGLLIARSRPDGTPERPQWLRITGGAIGTLLAAAGLGTLYIFHAAGTVYVLNGARVVGVAAAVGGAVALALAVARRPRAAFLAIVLALVTLNWVFVIRVLPSFERYKPVPRLSAAIQQRLEAGDAVVHYNVALPSMVFYLRRHIDVLFEREVFLRAFRENRTVFAVLSAQDYAALRPEIGVPTCVLERESTVNVKLKAVLARDPLPEVLLITNECR